MTDDSQVDTRDLRDPAAIGEEILSHRHLDRASSRPLTASQIYDNRVKGITIRSYSPSSSTVNETVAAYRVEMQAKAAQGDLIAVRTLLDKGWALPDDMDQATLERAREMRSVRDEVVFDAPVRKEATTRRTLDHRVCWGEGGPWLHKKHMWKNEDGEFICPGKTQSS